MNDFLSSKQVALMLGVNESSVKRWADSNQLPCTKTPGGHRKFTLLDVNEFVSKHDSQKPVNIAVPDSKKIHQIIADKIENHDFSGVADHFYPILLSADRQSIFEFLKFVHIRKINYTRIFDSILQPALVKLGIEWQENRISVDEEHRASSAVFSTLVRLNAETVKKPLNGKTAVLAVIQNDYHEIPIKCLKFLMEYEGWTIIYLGANAPNFSIDNAVRKHKPTVTLISSTVKISDQTEIENWLLNVKMFLKSFDGKLIVGGNGLTQNKHTTLSVDHWGKNFTGTMDFVKKHT